MPLNAKKAATNAAHMAKLDMIRLQPYKAEGAAIRAAASAAGQSLQGYVLQAVRERMTAEGQPLTLDDLPGADSAGGDSVKP